jgi:putative glutamine amidotransferase
MAGRPRVGVTGDGRRWAPSWWCLSLALRLAGAVPERLSVRHEPSGEALDALIISGGNDIGPDLYGGTPHPKTRVDAARDALEIRWIEHACEQELPLLGICRGAQLINVVLGGSLHQDIRPLRKKTYNRPGLLPTKQVFVQADSRIGSYLRRRKLRVNSLHHQAIKSPGMD